eukprot:scaffold64453_cov24-Phaeocystis_antarctica.AAC.1
MASQERTHPVSLGDRSSRSIPSFFRIRRGIDDRIGKCECLRGGPTAKVPKRRLGITVAERIVLKTATSGTHEELDDGQGAATRSERPV